MSSRGDELNKGHDDVNDRPGLKRKRNSASDDDAAAYQSSSDASNESQGSSPEPVSSNAPRVTNGIVDFKISSLVSHFTCQICFGLFREPVTITECLHTFCKSCLFSLFCTGGRKCPTCETDLGPDPFNVALNDRTLQELTDKVLFPGLKAADEADEREFYAKRGIRMKPEFADASGKDNDQKRRSRPRREDSFSRSTTVAPVIEADNELTLSLVPDKLADSQSQLELPPLDRSCIRTSGRLKIVQLKRYLLKKLNMPPTRLPSVEIMCNGSPVGNELSLTFIDRTIWTHTGTDKPLKLTFKLAESGFL